MSDTIDRNCDKCIHHTSGTCSSWDCKMQTVEGLVKETRARAIEEFSERIKARAYSTERNDWSADYMISIWESVIDEIAMELKGE